MSARHLYKVIFVNQGKVYEIYARSVTQGTLFGFIEVERLVFGERTTVVVDPAEERIKTEFAGVRRTYLPMHSILRIDEVEKQGVSKVTPAEAGNVTPVSRAHLHAGWFRRLGQVTAPRVPPLIWPGGAALSGFRLEKLLRDVQARVPAVTGVAARFLHVVELASR